MQPLLTEIKNCQTCAGQLPNAPKPVMSASASSRILIIGQAPGSKVQASGIPWDDPSGNLLREWLEVDKTQFYNEQYFGLIPMGFCYPGKGNSGDLPPRPECAPQWHPKIFKALKTKPVILLIGQYSQAHYLGDRKMRNLTETVRKAQSFLPDFFPLPHPSPRNRFWMKKNPWFNKQTLPALRKIIRPILSV